MRREEITIRNDEWKNEMWLLALFINCHSKNLCELCGSVVKFPARPGHYFAATSRRVRRLQRI